MKVTINEVQEDSDFPTVRQLIDPEEDIVILFISEEIGVVLVSSKHTYDIGSTHSFVSCYNEDVWKQCSVTLES